MINDLTKKILKEIGSVLESVDDKEVTDLISCLVEANKIVVCGAGRVGMATRGFGMRLGHLGLNAFTLGDSTVPSICKGDVFLVSSGSGETQTIYDLAVIAKESGAMLVLITGNPNSRIGKIADRIVLIKAPSKTKPVDGFSSIQPMTTLNEQCLGIFFDAVVLELMKKMDETHETMWKRHSNLE
ncbi:MAG: 6-phospho 3-hexuloisomerase [candidate division WWE3 bacterium GW2011_GWF2_41_45]|nr:MAG: 6-phospho 3-hexuloisomerase [candidate division WWE3 bacterium GW2011_GWF2_41_45]